MVREKIKKAKDKFRSELKKALFTALVAAFGFLIALSWRDVIQSYVDTIVSFTPLQGQLISALTVTLIAVLGILIVTKFLDEKAE